MRRVACLALALSAAGCRTAARPPSSPEQTVRELGEAARAQDPVRLFRLLDTESRWSLMSVHKDLLKLCGLVRAHYPKQRQAHELQRCRLADSARDPQAMFALWAKERGLATSLAKLPADAKPTVAGERATLESAGLRAELCRATEGWTYCGLREELERLKLKAARDVATIQENVEAYRGR